MSGIYWGEEARRRLQSLPTGEPTVILTPDQTLAVAVRAPYGAGADFLEIAAAGMLQAVYKALDELKAPAEA